MKEIKLTVEKIFQLWRDGHITTGTAFKQAHQQLTPDQYIDLLEKMCSTITEE